jgi:hypothetical protein
VPRPTPISCRPPYTINCKYYTCDVDDGGQRRTYRSHVIVRIHAHGTTPLHVLYAELGYMYVDISGGMCMIAANDVSISCSKALELDLRSVAAIYRINPPLSPRTIA